jgi:hypothetical protein
MSGFVEVPTCRHCNSALGQEAEKAIGNGEFATVWTSLLTGDWVCPVTGDEHCPIHLPCAHRPVITAGTAGAFIVMEGNPVDGFVFHGIPAFDDHDAAVEWAEENCTEGWWVVPLQDVE